MSHAEFSGNSGSTENGPGKVVRKTIIHPSPPVAVFFNANSTPNKNERGDQEALNLQLRQKFSFFLQDLLRVCSVANINFPLNLLNERGPLTPIQPFLKKNGLKYVFQFIQTHASNLQISRAGFSLLIICITFLRKLHQDFKSSPGQVQLEEKLWITQSYAKLTDTIAIGSCMSIFITTHDAVVQELILNLVANLILVSEESASCLLQAPSIFNKNRHSLDSPSSHISLKRSINNRGGTADTTDSRRTMMTNNPNNMSFRDVTRPNSRNSTFGTGDDSSSNNNNSCLAYMLSVVILQRNRHQLLGAAAEIIILLSRDGSNPLCQHIARLSSCPLPLLSALEQPRSSNNNRATYGFNTTSTDTNTANNPSNNSNESNNLACNPLTTKVIDWAGVKVFLKFLQRYHQLLPRSTDTNEDDFQLQFNQQGDGSGENDEKQEEEYDPSQINPAAMMSEELRNEYHAVHHRALLAICLLIRGAQEIASYLVQLPGAVDVLRASANVFNEMHVEDHDGAVIIAINALQLEKQKLRRMKMLANANNAIAKNKNRKNTNEAKRLAKIAAAHSSVPTTAATTATGGRRNTTRGSNTSTSPTRNSTSSTSIHGKRLKPLFGNNITMSPAKLEKHEDHVTLAAPTHVVNFQAEYPVMTEKHSLYLQTHAMQKEASDPMNNDVSPLQKAAVARLVAGAAGPLHSEGSHDTLLSTSLKIIDAETNDNILDMNLPFDGIASNNGSVNTVRNNTAMSSFNQLPWSAMDQSSSLSFLPRPLDGNETPHKLAMIEPWDHGLSAYRDFFQVLPHCPGMPARIEPQDVIHGNEDLDKIREKFQAIAAAAVKKIHNKGMSFVRSFYFLYLILAIAIGVMFNGKSTVSIDERARRIYSPPPEKRMSASFSIPPSRAPSRSRSPTAASASSSLTSNNVNKRPKSGLQPLDLSEANQLELASLSSGRGRYPALSHRDGSDANIPDPEKTPAWNPRPEGLAYYGIRLDNVEFEEQDLFDRFKPIFDYDAPEPAPSPKKGKTVDSGTGGFQATRGKITGEMEQTNDLLLI